MAGMEGSTNDISHYIGLLDPWYERNVLGLMNLPMDVLCQVCARCPFPRSSLENLLLCHTDTGCTWGSWWSAGGCRPRWGGVGWQLWLEVPPSHFLPHSALPVCQARG